MKMQIEETRKRKGKWIWFITYLVIIPFFCQPIAWASHNPYKSYRKNGDCLSPQSAQAELADIGSTLETGFISFRATMGKEALSEWLDLGYIAAFFGDYVSSLPEGKKSEYFGKYQNYLQNKGGLQTEIDNHSLNPRSISNVVSLQRADVGYGACELIANGIDATLKAKELYQFLIGQFGEGFFVCLKELEESKDPNDRVVLESSTDGVEAIRAEFRRVKGDYYIKFKVIKEGVRQGTRIRVHRSDFGETVTIDGQEVTHQELRNRKIRKAYQYNLSIPIKLNGEKLPVNALENFNDMQEIRNREPEYLIENQCIEVHTYDDGYEIVDPGIGIDKQVFFEQLLVPQKHEDEDPEAVKEFDEGKLEAQARLYYQKPSVVGVTTCDVVLQVAGVLIEQFKIEGIQIPERMVINLPNWSNVGGEGRNKIKMDEWNIRSFKYLINQVLEHTSGDEQDLLLNGLAGIAREKQRIEREVGQLKKGDDLLEYLFNSIAQSKILSNENEMVLPNEAVFLKFKSQDGCNKRYLDSSIFHFDPWNTPGISMLTKYKVFQKHLFLIDFSDPEVIYEEWGNYVFIDKTIWYETEAAAEDMIYWAGDETGTGVVGTETVDVGLDSEAEENLVKHLEHVMSFYIGYGPRPNRIRFEKSDEGGGKEVGEEVVGEKPAAEVELGVDPEMSIEAEPRAEPEPELEPEYDYEARADELLEPYRESSFRIGNLRYRIIGDLKRVSDPIKESSEISMFLSNLEEFLKLVLPYMEGIQWEYLLFRGISGKTLARNEFKLFYELQEKKQQLHSILEKIHTRLGYEFNNGRNKKARERLIENLVKVPLWHFETEQIILFLPFFKVRLLRLLSAELLAEWYGWFHDNNFNTILRYSQFLNLCAPVVASTKQLARYSERWYKIFSMYPKHRATLIESINQSFNYSGRLPGLPGEIDTYTGSEPDWGNVTEHEPMKVGDRRTNCFDITEDRRYIVTDSENGKVKLWEKDKENNTYRFYGELGGLSGSIKSIKFSPCGRYLAMKNYARNFQLWNVNQKEKILDWEEKIMDSDNAIQFSPDSKYISIISKDCVATIYNLFSGEVEKTIRGEYKQYFNNFYVKFSRDSAKLLWYQNEHMECYSLENWEKTTFYGVHYGVSAEFSPCGNYVAASYKGITLILCVNTGTIVDRIRHKGEHASIRFSPCGKYLILHFILSSHDVIVYDMSKNSSFNILNSKYDRFLCLSPNDEYALFNDPDSNAARVIELKTGTTIQKLPGAYSTGEISEFTADGEHIITIDINKVLKVWRIGKHEPIKTINVQGVRKALLMDNGSEVIVLGNKQDEQGSTSAFLHRIEAGEKQATDASMPVGLIPGWRFLQDEVDEGQAPIDLQKYLKYLKPEHAEFLVEHETKPFNAGDEGYSIEDIELARLILLARLKKNEIYKRDLSLEDVKELLDSKDVKELDLSDKFKEIDQKILAQEDNFCLFLRELIQNSRDAIKGEGSDPGEEVDFTGFLGQGFYTLFSDFDEIRLKTSLGDGVIHYLTFVKAKDKKTGQEIIKLSKIERKAQGEVREKDMPLPKEIDVRSYIPKGKKEWIVSVTDPVGMDLFTIINCLLTPDESLKEVGRKGDSSGKFWKGTEIQRVKYFESTEEEPQLEALMASEYLSLYAGAVNEKDAVIYYNRFPGEPDSGQKMNKEKEKLSKVSMPEGDLNMYWTEKRKYHRMTHKDLYFADPKDHSNQDYTEFMPNLLADKLYAKGMVIDISCGMRLIRTRNSLADEGKHLLPLKKAVAVSSMKSSIYLMIKHGIWLPTLPQDFYMSVTQSFEFSLNPDNVALAEKINEGKWNDITSEEYTRLADPANFNDLIQVLRNIKIEWKDNAGKTWCMSLEEQRRKIRNARSIEEVEDLLNSVAPNIRMAMEEGFETVKKHETAGKVKYNYTEMDIAKSPVLNCWRRLLNQMAVAMESDIINKFCYRGKPSFGYQSKDAMHWNIRAFINDKWIDKLIKLIDSEEIDIKMLCEFLIWQVEEIVSHEYVHVYEIRNKGRRYHDTHQEEKAISGAFGAEQKKLLRKIIKNRLHLITFLQELRREFSKEARQDRFGTKEWDTDNLKHLAEESGERYPVFVRSLDTGNRSSMEVEEVGGSI